MLAWTGPETCAARPFLIESLPTACICAMSTFTHPCSACLRPSVCPMNATVRPFRRPLWSLESRKAAVLHTSRLTCKSETQKYAARCASGSARCSSSSPVGSGCIVVRTAALHKTRRCIGIRPHPATGPADPAPAQPEEVRKMATPKNVVGAPRVEGTPGIQEVKLGSTETYAHRSLMTQR